MPTEKKNSTGILQEGGRADCKCADRPGKSALAEKMRFTILNKNLEPRSLIKMVTLYLLILKRKSSCHTHTHTRHMMQLSPML